MADTTELMEEAEDMKRYVALLRGINISGKIKVPMAELKTGFEKLAFEEVKTYLNSGNVIFSSDEDDTKKLTKQIQEFSLKIDEALRTIGFKRISSGELYDKESTMIQKILTYEATALEEYK